MRTFNGIRAWATAMGLALAGCLVPGLALAQAQPLPAESYFKQADFIDAALSPSGRWVALTTGAGSNRVSLVVFEVATLKPLAVAASFGDADVTAFHWVNDERLVFQTRDLQSGGGDQRFAPGLFSVRRDGTAQRELIRVSDSFVREARMAGTEPLTYDHTLLHVPRTGGDEVIVGQGRWDANNREWRDVVAKRLNTVTGRTTNLSLGAPDRVQDWMFDDKGEPRLVVTNHEGRTAVHWREAGTERPVWKQLLEHPTHSGPWWPQQVDSSGALFVTVQGGRGQGSSLRRFNFQTGQPEKEALASTPGFDFRGFLISESAGSRTLGLFLETDAATTVWFDPVMKALQTEADRLLPGRINLLNCARCGEADMTVLLTSSSDRDPGSYLVYTAADKRWRMLVQRRAGIEPKLQATVDFDRFKARDGRSIPVWVTRPAGSKPGQALPTVVLVHGGPWVRGGQWVWDRETQFLASRGYLVIEPEFRGSTGYGFDHFRAGWKQWGQAMQDDVADATLWAIAQGMADKGRICIAGASYGGYSTLMGLIRHGELYRCGVAWVAVTDPRLMYDWRPDSDGSAEWRRWGLPELVGDRHADASMIDANTPVLQAHRIKAPLLLAMGAQDARVPPVHGERLRDAMAKAGKPLEWVLYPDEGHGWLKPANRVDFYRRMEAFLAQHLAAP